MPGERIVEEEIAEKFHVSRGPVREALRHIEEEGLITYESHKGCTVKEISYEEMQEKYLVRSTLEILAVRIIAEIFRKISSRRCGSVWHRWMVRQKKKTYIRSCVWMRSSILVL